MIRLADTADVAAIEIIVRAAYSGYIGRIGKPPGPMLDDYRRLIADGTVSLLEGSDGRIVGVIVLLPQSDHLLLDNVAVEPRHRGQGFGRKLIAFAEAEARRRGFAELRLYTHQTMTENIAIYRRLGFVETGRRGEGGYDRVFMRKTIGYFP